MGSRPLKSIKYKSTNQYSIGMSLTVEEIKNQTFLGSREAEAFDLRFRQGLSRKETGEEMGIKASTVQTYESIIKEKREKCERTIEVTEDIED